MTEKKSSSSINEFCDQPTLSNLRSTSRKLSSLQESKFGQKRPSKRALTSIQALQRGQKISSQVKSLEVFNFNKKFASATNFHRLSFKSDAEKPTNQKGLIREYVKFALFGLRNPYQGNSLQILRRGNSLGSKKTRLVKNPEDMVKEWSKELEKGQKKAFQENVNDHSLSSFSSSDFDNGKEKESPFMQEKEQSSSNLNFSSFSQKSSVFDKFGSVSNFLSKIFSRDSLRNSLLRRPNNISNDFSLTDFNFYHAMRLKQKEVIKKEIAIIFEDQRRLNLSKPLLDKWLRAKQRVKFAIRVNKFNADIKIFGSTSNVGTEIRNDRNFMNKLFVRQETIFKKSQYGPFAVKEARKKRDFFNLGIIHPSGRFMSYWSFFVIFLLIYTATITPYRVSFVDSSILEWTVLDYMVDSLFLTDIFITLNLAYCDKDGKLIENRCKIFIAYLKSWLLIDIVGIFPFQFLDTSSSEDFDAGNTNDFIKMLRLPRLYRLMKLTRLYKMMNKSENLDIIKKLPNLIKIKPHILKVLKFLLMVMVFVHLMGCLWHFEAKLQDYGPKTWIFEINYQDRSNYDRYILSIYWAICTLSTVGFGDVHANNNVEYVISIIWMILGAGFYSFTIGTLSDMIVNSESRSGKLTRYFSVIDQFCKINDFSKSLKKKIKDTLSYASKKTYFNTFEKDEFLNEIPTDLKYQIASNMFKDIHTSIKFFSNKDEVFYAYFATNLQPLYIKAGEFIYKKGEHPHSVYFLLQGRVNLITGFQNLNFKTFVQGSYFGELEILSGSSRNFSVRAEENSNLLTIAKEEFLNIIRLFPEYECEIITIANKRHQKNLKSYKKVQDLIKISKNSIFWSLKRSKSLFDIVRLRKDPSEYYFLNPKSLFPKGQSKTKKTLLPSRFFLNKLIRIHLKNKRKAPISLFTSSKQNEFDIITGLYEKVIDNTHDLQKLRKNSDNLFQKYLREESKKSPRHNQVHPLNDSPSREFSLNQCVNDKDDKEGKESIISFQGESTQLTEPARKKSDFFKFKKIELLHSPTPMQEIDLNPKETSDKEKNSKENDENVFVEAHSSKSLELKGNNKNKAKSHPYRLRSINKREFVRKELESLQSFSCFSMKKEEELSSLAMLKEEGAMHKPISQEENNLKTLENTSFVSEQKAPLQDNEIEEGFKGQTEEDNSIISEENKKNKEKKTILQNSFPFLPIEEIDSRDEIGEKDWIELQKGRDFLLERATDPPEPILREPKSLNMEEHPIIQSSTQLLTALETIALQDQRQKVLEKNLEEIGLLFKEFQEKFKNVCSENKALKERVRELEGIIHKIE